MFLRPPPSLSFLTFSLPSWLDGVFPFPSLFFFSPSLFFLWKMSPHAPTQERPVSPAVADAAKNVSNLARRIHGWTWQAVCISACFLLRYMLTFDYLRSSPSEWVPGKYPTTASIHTDRLIDVTVRYISPCRESKTGPMLSLPSSTFSTSSTSPSFS